MHTNSKSLFFAFVSLLLFAVSPLSAQKIKTVECQHVYYASENMSITEIKDNAIQQAKVQAIAKEFGSIVSQVSNLMEVEDNERSTSDFLSLTDVDVKGEWLETIEERVGNPVFEPDGIVWVDVYVKGKAREIVSAEIELDVKVLRNGTEDRFTDNVFLNGDELYLSFAAPTDGYLAVYLIDTDKEAYCLLPYQYQTDGIYQTKANKKYVFFSTNQAPADERAMVDEYTLTASSDEPEINYIYVVFSPNSFVKASDNHKEETLPRNLSYKKFQEWLAKCRKVDVAMSRKIFPITIKP